MSAEQPLQAVGRRGQGRRGEQGRRHHQERGQPGGVVVPGPGGQARGVVVDSGQAEVEAGGEEEAPDHPEAPPVADGDDDQAADHQHTGDPQVAGVARSEEQHVEQRVPPRHLRALGVGRPHGAGPGGDDLPGGCGGEEADDDAAHGGASPQRAVPLLPGEAGQGKDPDDEGEESQRDEGVGVGQGQAGHAEAEQHGSAPAVRAPHDGHHRRQHRGQERLAQEVGPEHAVAEQPVGEGGEGDAGQGGGDGDRDARSQHPAGQQHQAEGPDQTGADQHRGRDAGDDGGAAEQGHRGRDTVEGRRVEAGAARRGVAGRVQRRDVALLEHPARVAEVEDRVGVLGKLSAEPDSGRSTAATAARASTAPTSIGHRGPSGPVGRSRRTSPASPAKTQRAATTSAKVPAPQPRPTAAAATPPSEMAVTDRAGPTPRAVAGRQRSRSAATTPGRNRTRRATAMAGRASSQLVSATPLT